MKTKLIQISLTNRCNKECSYCPIKKWRNLECPTPLTNHIILSWLENYSPDEWYIEITGGEPTLYRGFGDLMYQLGKLGYEGLVKTNGSMAISPIKGFKRIAAWHEQLPIDGSFDMILIIDTVSSLTKAEYCLKHKIPFKMIAYHNQESGRYSFAIPPHKFTDLIYLDPNSKVHSCTGNMDFVPMFCEESMRRRLCSTCKTITDFEVFL